MRTWKKRLREGVIVSLVLGSLVIWPNQVAASQEIVASDQVQNAYVAVSTVLYKDIGELDPNYDYYAIKVTVDDLQNRRPSDVTTTIFVPSYAEEVPANHLPKAGFTASPQSLTFSYMGISFPMFGGGQQTDWSTGATFPGGLLRHFQWFQHYTWDTCARVFDDYGDYSVGVRVPAGAGLFAYASATVHWPLVLLCYNAGPYEVSLSWSFARSNAGGAANFRSVQISGVPDAPDSGAPLAIASSRVSGMIGGFTGRGDTSWDGRDRYQKGLAPGYTLVVTVDSPGNMSIRLCLEVPTDVCSRPPTWIDLLMGHRAVEYYNPLGGQPKNIGIRVESTAPFAGAYELQYAIAHR